jgi:hypothetical protein
VPHKPGFFGSLSRGGHRHQMLFGEYRPKTHRGEENLPLATAELPSASMICSDEYPALWGKNFRPWVKAQPGKTNAVGTSHSGAGREKRGTHTAAGSVGTNKGCLGVGSVCETGTGGVSMIKSRR